jgi:hypothetical protein
MTSSLFALVPLPTSQRLYARYGDEPNQLGAFLARFRKELAADVRTHVLASAYVVGVAPDDPSIEERVQLVVAAVLEVLTPLLESPVALEDKIAVLSIAAQTMCATLTGWQQP